MIHRCGRWILFALFALYPIFFLPFTENYYDTNKWMLLVVASVLMFILWFIDSINAKRLTLSLSKTSIGLLALFIATIVSLLVSSTNKTEALVSVFGPISIGSLCVVSFFGQTFFTTNSRNHLRFLLLAVTSLLGLIAIYQFFGLGKAFFPQVGFIGDAIWTPVGSAIGGLTILLIAIPLAIGRILEAIQHKQETRVAVYMIMLLLMTVGAIVTIQGILPKLSLSLLPFPAGWNIILEGLKHPKQAFFGIGAENFLTAFSAGRPAWLNNGPLWSSRFGTNVSLLFHFVSVFGVVSLVGILLFYKGFLKGAMNIRHGIVGVCTGLAYIVAGIAFFIAPPNITVFAIIIALLFIQDTHGNLHTWKKESKTYGIVLGICALIFIPLCVGVFIAGRYYVAELHYRASLAALQKQDAQGVYGSLNRAIKTDPDISKYHLSLSQMSVVIANALAQNQPASPSAATADQTTITSLIKQSVDSGKRAAHLSPTSPVVWENLGYIYKELSGTTKGADQWAIASYQQAIALDPTNPTLRLVLGSVFVGQENYDRAREQFLAAASLKPNYINAHYNAAYVYKMLGQPVGTAIELSRALALATKDEDKQKMQRELTDVKKLLTKDQVDQVDGDTKAFIAALKGTSINPLDEVGPLTSPLTAPIK